MSEPSASAELETPASSGASPDASQVITKKRFSRNQMIMGSVVIAFVLMFWMTARKHPVPVSTVTAAPTVPHSDPALAPDAIAQKVKDKDAENAQRIMGSKSAIDSGMSYVPTPTKEYEDPLAEFAQPTQSGVVAAAPAAPVPIPATPIPVTPTTGQNLNNPLYAAPVPTQVPQTIPRVPVQAAGAAGPDRAGGSPMVDAMHKLQENAVNATVAGTSITTTDKVVLKDEQDEKSQTLVKASSETSAAAGIVDQVPVAAKNPGRESKSVVARLGELAYAVLDLEANSDSTDFVMATVAGGKFTGAKFFGSFVRHDEVLELKFKRVQWRKGTFKIDAIGVNPDEPKVGMATEVNHHYITRFGGLFLAGFAKGVATTLSQEGQTTSITGTAGVAGATISLPQKTLPQLGVIGAGNAVSNASELFEQNAKRPITVIIAAGTPVGVLFVDDWVYDPQDVKADLKANNLPASMLTSDSSDGSDGSYLEHDGAIPSRPGPDVGGEPPHN